jgi:hypothetical protein
MQADTASGDSNAGLNNEAAAETETTPVAEDAAPNDSQTDNMPTNEAANTDAEEKSAKG